MLTCDEYLYVIRCQSTGVIKVGRSQDPDERLKQMQTGCPTELRLTWKIKGAAFLERLFHELFQDERIRGEWYPKDSNAARTVNAWKLGPFRDTGSLLETFGHAVEAATRGGMWVDREPWATVSEDAFRAHHAYALKRAGEWDTRAFFVASAFEEKHSATIDGRAIHKPSGETWKPQVPTVQPEKPINA